MVIYEGKGFRMGTEGKEGILVHYLQVLQTTGNYGTVSERRSDEPGYHGMVVLIHPQSDALPPGTEVLVVRRDSYEALVKELEEKRDDRRKS